MVQQVLADAAEEALLEAGMTVKTQHHHVGAD
jgi:hypothetical protein